MAGRGLRGVAQERPDSAMPDELVREPDDVPCPICGDEVEVIVPAHGMSIEAGDVDERTCIGYGPMFGMGCLLVFEHGDAGPTTSDDNDSAFEEADGVDIGFEEA